ncbi:MAG TPA: choice-of-anchor D domain-containing protein [Solirubrobacterales bacterium]
MSRAVSIAVIACLAAGSIAVNAGAASSQSVASASKKCNKKKNHRKKRRCKRKAALPASIVISPTSQDFGIVQLPQGPTRSLAITNTGGSPSGLPVPSITGSNPESFGVIANGCAAPLGPGLTCQIDVDLLPQGLGPVSATLSVTAVPGGVASATMTGKIEA